MRSVRACQLFDELAEAQAVPQVAGQGGHTEVQLVHRTLLVPQPVVVSLQAVQQVALPPQPRLKQRSNHLRRVRSSA